MATNIDLYLDAGGRGLLVGGSSQQGALPELTRNDVYNVRLRIQTAPAGVIPYDIDTTGTTLKFAIGNIDETPTDGDFLLTVSGPVTSSAIPYNATTTQVFNAISGIAGQASVTTYGNEDNAWLITAATNNTALSFGGSSSTLFPTSSVLVSTRRFPAANVKAQQIIKLRRNPAVYSDSFVASPTAGIVSLSKTQDGSATANETYKLSIGADAAGGGIILTYGSHSSSIIPIDANPVSAQDQLGAVTGIGSSNISVVGLVGENGYSISFVGALSNQNITTALVLDASNVYFAPWRESLVTMGTSELDELFADSDTTIITPTVEIEMVDSNNGKTLYQGVVNVRKDLIIDGSVIPADQASYYTKAEADSIFVEDSTSNVDATNRRLKNSGGTTIVDYGASLFGASGMVNLSSSQVTIGNFPTYIGSSVTVAGAVSLGSSLAIASNVGFFGTTPIAKPSGANAVSNVISLGLIASSATYGVLPQSLRTVTTLASVTFGTVGGNDQHYRDVVVTGAEVNDIVLVGLPSAVSSGIVIQGVAYKSNTVCLCANHTDTGSVDLNTATYRITVIGY